MAEDSEKRFHAVMDKLFFAPPPSSKPTRTPRSSSATAGGFFRGKKRSHMMTTPLAVVDSKSIGATIEELRKTSSGTVESPMCRPWDREDLLQRLATFKSMTWFAKPEVVSAINCARRGWINVDMDIIACESCGARLFFSTPSSWAQQQVENAASVFSIKLNNGHKLLCPWVDNACDEKLAQFPPTSQLNLVDDYKTRCASLLQLLELPVISSSAINHMQDPLLEHFLKNPPTLDMYYQAQKLISLCGWEPKLLPYIVDCKDITLETHNSTMTVYSSNLDANIHENNDHTSVVLECRLCGARVGLWAFTTTPRPAEFVRLIGHAEPTTVDSVEEVQTTGPTSSNRNVLNLTIAGGPPPAEQDFRPTISLPVVGQNLRTRFSSAFQSVHLPQDVPAVNDSGKDKDLSTKGMEFDPIKQHRHFCPWIVATGKSAGPGWKQTLSALQRHKEFISPSPITTTDPSSSLIQVEDPVGYVKKLLTPPSAKRKKFTYGSTH
ncbi:hypothetical protein LXL04_008772 [Taraxacum kok-saghyz]